MSCNVCARRVRRIVGSGTVVLGAAGNVQRAAALWPLLPAHRGRADYAYVNRSAGPVALVPPKFIVRNVQNRGRS